MAVIGGPAVGGLLYLGGALTVYRVCAVLFTLSMLLTLWVRYPHVVRQHSLSWQSLFAGVAFVWQRKVLLGAISLDLFAVLLGGATALLPMFARDILHVGPDGLGLLRSAPAVGALCMSIAITRWPIQRRVGYKLLAAVAVFGLASMVFGMSDHFVLSMVALAVPGAADNISVVTRLTLMQMETPDEMRGRVAAVNGVFIGASNELGEFESGLTAARWRPVAWARWPSPWLGSNCSLTWPGATRSDIATAPCRQGLCHGLACTARAWCKLRFCLGVSACAFDLGGWR